ncbi:MAG: hypothetical protein IPP10_14520 [Candidatus Competibacteraceae bacterium]|jgi:hypothetical protein|nr:hypothetical protein [Candidatus Competibacteraceae bacterium]MBK7542520.1 hypothetical protein [Candidatus Competibacteraceae bacterium]MBK7982112.1 hypothetical protein [Candidatus Competibacteraceae bacterium]MBK9952682.1 hypothetical protein [Candidatus Competibacteraceae bacterium]
METLKTGGANDSGSALTVLPSLKRDTSSAPRMLTPSEIDWLKRNQKAVAEQVASRLRQTA